MQAKHALERLVNQVGLHSIGSVPKNVGNYRLHQHIHDSSSSEDEEKHEVYDEEDDKGGTVEFTVDSVEN